jgi:hypothetical protein
MIITFAINYCEWVWYFIYSFIRLLINGDASVLWFHLYGLKICYGVTHALPLLITLTNYDDVLFVEMLISGSIQRNGNNNNNNNGK